MPPFFYSHDKNTEMFEDFLLEKQRSSRINTVDLNLKNQKFDVFKAGSALPTATRQTFSFGPNSNVTISCAETVHFYLSCPLCQLTLFVNLSAWPEPPTFMLMPYCVH